MKNIKFLKILSINLFIFILLTIIVDLLFGEWRKNFITQRNYFQIPSLIKDTTLKYDARWIYSSKEPISIIYYRDKNGYRSKNAENKKPIILTIGGSTTDQRFVTDGETWQDILDKKIPKFDFVNGGVDGQSSYGYKSAISYWHSKYLDPNKTDSILFYTGTNDVRFISNDFTNYDFAQTKFNYFKNLLKDNSFIIDKVLKLRNRIEFASDSKKTELRKVHNTHYARIEDFKKQGTIYEIKDELKLTDYLKYTEIYISLLKEAKNKFPNSNLIVVQQQIPGCNFVNKMKVIDRHPDNFEPQFCLDLMKVYLIQEKVISRFFKDSKIKIAPMYLKKYIGDDDVYDFVHSNSKGSLKIAEYIASFMKLNF